MHCAPSLAGIKSANLISCPQAAYPNLPHLLQEYQSAFQMQKVRLELLSTSHNCFLILVFRKQQLERQLQNQAVCCLLSQLGYPVEENTDAVLRHLKQRLSSSHEFPHEIGLFLGYPPEDVLGFIQHHGKNYKLCGYWKVYANERQTAALFARYKQCTKEFCGQFAKGISMEQLIRTM